MPATAMPRKTSTDSKRDDSPRLSALVMPSVLGIQSFPEFKVEQPIVLLVQFAGSGRQTCPKKATLSRGFFSKGIFQISSPAWSSPKARAFELLPKVRAVHADDAAHLVQARAHAFADAIAESFVACRPSGRERSRHCCRRFVRKIRGDDGRADVVVAGVEDKAHRVPNPFGGPHSSEFVEHEHFCLENRLQQTEFSGLH